MLRRNLRFALLWLVAFFAVVALDALNTPVYTGSNQLSQSDQAVIEAGILPKVKRGLKYVNPQTGEVECHVGKGKNCWVIYWGSSRVTISGSGVSLESAEE